jgi:hypothetical protein
MNYPFYRLIDGPADLKYGPAATHQVEHQNHQSDDQEQVDQAPADAHAESEKPQNQ